MAKAGNFLGTPCLGLFQRVLELEKRFSTRAPITPWSTAALTFLELGCLASYSQL